MNLKTIAYFNYEDGLPQDGQHLIGQLRGDNIIVYQAFNAQISNYAVHNQVFGGDRLTPSTGCHGLSLTSSG
jgi:hypothetical protein